MILVLGPACAVTILAAVGLLIPIPGKCQGPGFNFETGFVSFEQSSYIFPEGSTGEVCLTIHANDSVRDVPSNLGYYIYTAVGSCSNSSCSADRRSSCYCSQYYLDRNYYTCYDIVDSCPNLDTGGHHQLLSSILRDSSPISYDEFSLLQRVLNFPLEASHGHRECVTITFFADNVTEGLKCFTLGAFGYHYFWYYYNYEDFHLVPVCKIDGTTIKFVETFYNVTEPGIVEVGIELMGNITFNTTFLIDVDFATATANVDYIGAPFNVTFTDEATLFMNITIIDDQLAEDDEVIVLMLSTQTLDSDIHVLSDLAQIWITDDDIAEFRFSQSSYNVGERDGVVSVCLELIRSVLSKDTTLRLIDRDGRDVTATNGDDFMNTRNLTFPSGTQPSHHGSHMCFDVTIFDDYLVEGIEKFVICALDDNTPEVYSDCTEIFIEDDDVAVFQFSRNTYNLDESNGDACVCLELVSGTLAMDIVIEVSSEEGMYASGSGSRLNAVEYVFIHGTGPTEFDAQKCRKIFISDHLTQPTNICGYTSMNLTNILILNNGCATIVLEDNNDEETACTVVDFIPFADLTAFPNFEELDWSKPDSFSDPINIPHGLLIGDQAVTTAYVNENGVISFKEPWRYSYPNRFPTSYFFTRRGLCVAPFWSDNDIRRAGTVLYATYDDKVDATTNKAGRGLLTHVNKYIQDRYTDEPFNGDWLLVSHWHDVHPSPHGEDNPGDFDTEELEKTNNYQGIIVTNGLSTYAIFTYICGEMEWSSFGTNNPAVVGYNLGSGYFYNHPLSGFLSIGESISCMIGTRRRGKRQNEMQTTNLELPLPVSQALRVKFERCRRAAALDNSNFIVVSLETLLSELEPCPCTLNQAKNDVGRFLKFSDNPLCYLSIPKEFNLIVRTATLTQKCCYNLTNGALQTSISDAYFGTMLLHHPVLDMDNYELTDASFRDACCSFGSVPSCNEFVQKRPINDCTGYQPPIIATGSGDPHYTTFDRRYYTINGFGEFILVEAYLGGNTEPALTFQGRLGMVSFWRVTTHVALSYGTDSVAFHFGMPPGFRVFQTKPAPAIEITEHIKTNGEVWYDSTQQAALFRQGNELTAIFFQSGIVIVAQVNPIGNEYYMNFRIQVPQRYSGNVQGMLGNFDGDSTNDFYRRGESSPLPNWISERELFEEFKTWQVSQTESLFYYDSQSRKRQAGGTYEDFQNLNFVPIFSDELNFTGDQRVLCEDNLQCLFDLAVTEETTFAMETLEQEKIVNTTTKTLQNFPPNISADSVFRVNIGTVSVYSLMVSDPGDNVTLRVQGEHLQTSVLTLVGDGVYVFNWNLLETTTEPLVFIATDSSGASSTFIPSVEICACANEGNCTRDGLLMTNSTAILNCQCHEAYRGTFCEEDHNGCSEIQCFEGVECMDVPAPGVGAVCGSCPFGFTGDSFKCYDIDECAQNSSLCDQLCINTDGSYFCSCEDGYELIEGTNQCRDVNECSGFSQCQQLCMNTEGSFTCNCSEGFTLAPDERNCTADDPCLFSSCSHICGVINGIEQCFCPIGFELSTPGGTQCTDRDECLNEPCDQLCSNTYGSFECSCMDGYELQANKINCKDIDECLVAALANADLCENDTSTQCINTDGSYECICVPGFERVNETCEVIENEAPPPTQVVVPSIGIDNSVNFTARTLTVETFIPSRHQRFRDVTSSVLNEFCSNTICTLSLLNGGIQEVRNLTVLPSSIAIPTSLISENENGQLQIVFYVQIEDGFLLRDQLEMAVQRDLEEYRTAGFIPGANISLPEFANLTEGERIEVCITITDDEQPLRRDILLSFSVIPNNIFSSVRDVAVMNASIAIPPGESEACLQLLAADDVIVEREESFTLMVEAVDPSDTVNGNVLISISDNDGARLTVHPYINTTEGGIQDVCVLADCNSQLCERTIPISLLLLFNCSTCDASDFNVSVLPDEIPAGSSQACFQFEAVDDEIVENAETLTLIVYALNPYDTTHDNSSISITDNDGVEVTLDDIMVIISEGEEFDVCLNISKLSEKRERDIYVSLVVTPEINSNDIGDITAENLSTTIPPGTSEACLQLLAVDDEIVEVEEVFVITLEAGNVNDVVFGNVSVNILDNDGATLKVNETVNLTEGEVQEICVVVEQTLERTVPFSIAFTLKTASSSDFNVLNQPVEIHAGESKACFQLDAVDDKIIEAEEMLTLVVETVYLNDTVDGNTTVIISDNDCATVSLINSTLYVTEGNQFRVCAKLVNGSTSLQRTVPITLSLGDTDDVKRINDSVETYEFTPDADELHCFNLIAIDDKDIESTEYHDILLNTVMQLDRIDTEVTIVIITDNDGLPSDVDINTVTVLITLKDLNTTTFNAKKQQLFKETAARAINEYCNANEKCQVLKFVTRRTWQADTSVRVTAEDIILRDIRNSNLNEVKFSMFVLTSDGTSLLSADTLINTIAASTDVFDQNGFSVSLLYDQETTELSPGVIAATVMSVVVVIILVIIFATVIIIYRKYKHNGKRSGAPNIYVEHTSLAVFNVGAKLDGDENVGEYEACDTDDEEKKESKA